MSDDQATEATAFDMSALLAQFKTPKRESSKARKARQKQIAASADGRSLRETRDAQLNVRTFSSIKEAVKKHTAARGEVLTLWVEEALKEKLKAEGYEIDE
jgi:predicted HicB family RNase H-like nuclease